jgi:sulfur relay (sulfurtransferase) DsrF/TusC family protein
MKAVALIYEFDNPKSNQWQFDKIMSAIAYDVDLKVVFMPDALTQLTENSAWKSLSIYGVEDIYFYNLNALKNINSTIKSQLINSEQLKIFIQQADIVL